jgi:hypothetical protein
MGGTVTLQVHVIDSSPGCLVMVSIMREMGRAARHQVTDGPIPAAMRPLLHYYADALSYTALACR